MEVVRLEITKSILLSCEFCRGMVQICRTVSGDRVALHSSPTCKIFGRPDAGAVKAFLDRATLKLDRGDA
jgi:hypothetical protein